MFNSRWLEEEDYPQLCEWWKSFRFPAVPQHLLPDNGKCGVMVSKGDVNVCAGFIYFTNSSFALCEYVVSNFEYKNKDRSEAIEELFEKMEMIAKAEGYIVLFSSVRNQPLINKMKNFGWHEGSESKEMSKNI